MGNEKICRHVFVFNKKDNGGEQVILTTDFFDNGDENNNIYLNQEISLQSYCNAANISLVGCQITPSLLRELANQLDAELCKIQGSK